MDRGDQLHSKFKDRKPPSVKFRYATLSIWKGRCNSNSVALTVTCKGKLCKFLLDNKTSVSFSCCPFCPIFFRNFLLLSTQLLWLIFLTLKELLMVTSLLFLAFLISWQKATVFPLLYSTILYLLLVVKASLCQPGCLPDSLVVGNLGFSFFLLLL